MKKIILAGIATSLLALGGCASQENLKNEFNFYESEKERIETNQIYNELHNITIQLVDFSNKEELNKFFLEREGNVSYLNNEKYLERLKTASVSDTTLNNLKLTESNIYTLPQSLKNTTTKKYIESLEVITKKDGTVKTSSTIGSVEFGQEIQWQIVNDEKHSNDILQLKLKFSDLIEINKHFMNDIDYIETPTVSVDKMETSLTFNKDAHFIKRINEKQVVVISIKKAKPEKKH